MANLAQQLHLYDEHAESGAIAGLINGRDVTTAIGLIEQLSPTDFYDPRKQLLFESVANVLRGIEPVTPTNILAEAARVRSERNITVTINDQYLDGLTGDVERAAEYAVTVRKWAQVRDLAEFAGEFLQRIQMNPDIHEFHAWAMSTLQTLGPTQGNGGVVYGWETVGAHRQMIDERMRQIDEGTQKQFDWPWKSWGKFIRPLRGGLVGLLIAPDGAGKSAMLSQIAEHWARRGHVWMVHLEDDLQYKLDRRLARFSGIPYDAIEDGRFTAVQLQKRMDTERRLEQAEWVQRLHYYHAPGKSAAQIVRELESKIAEGVCDAVVVDYLNKIQADRRQSTLFGNNKFERQADDMEQLKTFAERNRLPLFTASQGNASIYNAKEMSRKDIMGSKQVSHKSQLVAMLQREMVGSGGFRHPQTGELIAEEGEDSPIAKVRVDKQNRGKKQNFDMWYQGDRFMFTDLQRTPLAN